MIKIYRNSLTSQQGVKFHPCSSHILWFCLCIISFVRHRWCIMSTNKHTVCFPAISFIVSTVSIVQNVHIDFYNCVLLFQLTMRTWLCVWHLCGIVFLLFSVGVGSCIWHWCIIGCGFPIGILSVCAVSEIMWPWSWFPIGILSVCAVSEIMWH